MLRSKAKNAENEARQREKRLLPAKQVDNLPKITRPVSEALERQLLASGSKSHLDTVAASPTVATTTASMHSEWNFTPQLHPRSASPVMLRQTLPRPKPYPAMRTVLASSPTGQTDGPDSVRASLTQLNSYSLVFSQLLRELTPYDEGNISGQLADLWAAAMKTMVDAIQVAGVTASEKHSKYEQGLQETAAVRADLQHAHSDNRKLMEEVVRVKADLLAHRQRWRLNDTWRQNNMLHSESNSRPASRAEDRPGAGPPLPPRSLTPSAARPSAEEGRADEAATPAPLPEEGGEATVSSGQEDAPGAAEGSEAAAGGVGVQRPEGGGEESGPAAEEPGALSLDEGGGFEAGRAVSPSLDTMRMQVLSLGGSGAAQAPPPPSPRFSERHVFSPPVAQRGLSSAAGSQASEEKEAGVLMVEKGCQIDGVEEDRAFHTVRRDRRLRFQGKRELATKTMPISLKLATPDSLVKAAEPLPRHFFPIARARTAASPTPDPDTSVATLVAKSSSGVATSTRAPHKLAHVELEGMPLDAMHNLIVLLLLEVQELTPQVYMGQIYVGGDIRNPLEQSEPPTPAVSLKSPAPSPRDNREQRMMRSTERTSPFSHSPSMSHDPTTTNRHHSHAGAVSRAAEAPVVAAPPQAMHRVWNLPDMDAFVREFFLRKHGSKVLAEKHFTDFTIGVQRYHADSALVHTFARLCGKFDKLLPSAARFLCAVLSRTLSPSDPTCNWQFADTGVPMVPLDLAEMALAATFQSMGADLSPALKLRLSNLAVKVRSAEGALQTMPAVELGEMLDVSLAEWRDHHARCLEYIRSTFYVHFPKGEGLMHYNEFSAMLLDAAPRCPPAIVAQMFREVADLTRRQGAQNVLTVDHFSQVAEKHELLAWNAGMPQRERVADHRAIIAKRPGTEKDLVPPSFDAVCSLKALQYAWDSAKVGLDGWLRRWRLAWDGVPVIVQPATEEQQQHVLALVTRLNTLAETATTAVRSATVFIDRGGTKKDVDKAWGAYINTVCALEAAVLEHRKSIGIIDDRIWVGNTMRVPLNSSPAAITPTDASATAPKDE